MTRGGVAVALSVVLLGVPACGGALRPLPMPGAPAPEAAPAVRTALAPCASLTSVTAEVAVRGRIEGQRLRGRVLLGADAPDALYLEAPAPFGASFVQLWARDGLAQIYFPRLHRVVPRSTPAEALEALTGLPLDARLLRRLLLGCPPEDVDPSPVATSATARWLVVPGTPALYLRGGQGAMPWQLVAMVQQGPRGWRVDYEERAGGRPRVVRVSSEARRGDLTLTLSQVETNVPLPDAAFRAQWPADAEVVSIDAVPDVTGVGR